jgi:hypothetical protein
MVEQEIIAYFLNLGWRILIEIVIGTFSRRFVNKKINDFCTYCRFSLLLSICKFLHKKTDFNKFDIASIIAFISCIIYWQNEIYYL